MLRGTLVTSAHGTSSETIADWVLACVLQRALRLPERRALALGMQVRAVRRQSAALDMDGVQQAANIEDLMAASDHLALVAPGTEATRHVVNARALGLARPGLHLINVARGSLVDQQALIESLDAGQLSWASLDVTGPEPLPEGHPLHAQPEGLGGWRHARGSCRPRAWLLNANAWASAPDRSCWLSLQPPHSNPPCRQDAPVAESAIMHGGRAAPVTDRDRPASAHSGRHTNSKALP